MENKIFLLNLLKLSSNILEGNNEAIKIAKELNENELNENQQAQLKENINSLINQNLKNISLLKDVINNIDILNKQYLISTIELRTLDFQNKTLFKNIISEKLSDTTITFDNNIEKYVYYSLLVNLTIASKDIELIKLAIDKIQSI